MKNIILNKLLDKYERSGYVLGNDSGRAVAIAPKELGSYNSHDYESVHIVRDAVSELEREGLVYSEPDKENSHLIKRICLVLDNTNKAYEFAARTPISERKDQLLQLIESTISNIKTEWIVNFLRDEYEYISSKAKPNKYFFDDIDKTKALCRVLAFIDNSEAMMMRNISVQCFNDSKYLERNLVEKLISIARHYEPELVIYKETEQEKLTNNQILEQIGILTHSEILEFCGKVRLIVKGENINISGFDKGFCLQSEMVDSIDDIVLRRLEAVLFVENRTTYRQIIMQGVPEKLLVVYHGGFYSPLKGNFIRKLYNPVSNIRYYFWGDIDLGGFMMYDRLRKNIIPELIPYRMDLETFISGAAYGMDRGNSYCNTLLKYLELNTGSPFSDVIMCIIRDKKTVEQEILKLDKSTMRSFS